MTTARSPAIDEGKLNAFIAKALGDMGAAMSASLTIIGDKLGLYKALHEHGPLTSAELAQRTKTHERYVREWLAAQAAGGYVEYDPQTRRFTLPPEQAFMLADESSPLYVQGCFQIIEAAMADEPHITEAFKSGRGFGWHEHDARLFEGTERFFRPGYNAHLVGEWIPALDGVEAKLRKGAKVADVGCGLGASTIVMAKAYPNSTFVGLDYHRDSIELARERAATAGMGDRITFEVASAQDFPGSNYDLIACFDCLHDMGDPVGASAQILRALKPDGTWLLVEPFANDQLEENLNPIGRIFYAASTLLCTPASLSQDVALGLGAQAGEPRIREVVTRFHALPSSDANTIQPDLRGKTMIVRRRAASKFVATGARLRNISLPNRKETVMKSFIAVLCFAAMLVPAAVVGALAAGAPTIVMPGGEKFAPAPAPYPQGAMIAVLLGNPSERDSQYAVRLKLPENARIAPHTHGDTENVTVLSGTLLVGVGNVFDAAHMAALPAGSYASIPAGTPHFAMAKGETLLQINGVGPASITAIK